METNFPRCMKAGKRVDVDQWALADALLKEAEDKDTGPRGLKAVVADFANLGLEYEPRYLRMLRQAAETFPPPRRYDGEHHTPQVVLRAHIAAGNPDTLDVIVRAARKDDRKVTLEYVEHLLRRIRKEVRDERIKEREVARQELAEAEAEALKAEKRRDKAATDEERIIATRHRDQARDRQRKANEKVKNIKVAPSRKELPAPSEDEMGGLLTKTQFMADLGEIKRIIRRVEKDIESALPELSPTFINAAVEECLEAANSLRGLADVLRKNQSNKRGHLAAVS